MEDKYNFDMIKEDYPVKLSGYQIWRMDLFNNLYMGDYRGNAFIPCVGLYIICHNHLSYEAIVDYMRLERELEKDNNTKQEDIKELEEYYRHRILEYNNMMTEIFMEFIKDYHNNTTRDEEKDKKIISDVLNLSEKYCVNVLIFGKDNDELENKWPF